MENLTDGNKIKSMLDSFGFNSDGISSDYILSAMKKVEKIKAFMDSQAKVDEAKPIAQKSDNIYDSNKFIYASIPFLNEEYQRSIYIVVKLMELKRVFDMPVISIQSKTSQKSSFERRRELLNTIREYIPKEDATKLDNILRFMEMRRLMNIKEEMSFE